MNMTEDSTMMNSYGVPDLPQSQYYQPPPPAMQYSPFSQLPSLTPSSSSSSSQNAPTWFIVAVAVAAVIFCYLLYIFLRRQERKAGQSHDGSIAETEVEEEMPNVPKPQAPPSAKRLPTEAIPRDVRSVTWPDDCPTCSRRGGLYHFKYKCAGCSFKNDWGIHVQFPSGK